MSSAIALPRDQQESLAKSWGDCVLFSRDWLRHKQWWGQQDMLRSIFTNRRTAVAACHASSKTFTAAEALLHWVTFFKDGKVITTAPTDRQVRNLVWREVREAVPGSRLEFAKPPGVQTLEISPQNYAFGMSTKSQKEELAVRFQGLHGGHVLIIIDEAPGVEADIWDAISGIRAGGVVHVLAIEVI